MELDLNPVRVEEASAYASRILFKTAPGPPSIATLYPLPGASRELPLKLFEQLTNGGIPGTMVYPVS